MTQLLQVGFNYKMTRRLFNTGTVQSVRLWLWIGWQLFSNLQLVRADLQLLGDKLPSHQGTNHPVIANGRCGPAGCCNYLESAIKFDLKKINKKFNAITRQPLLFINHKEAVFRDITDN